MTGHLYRAYWTLSLANVTCDQECGFVQGIKEERFTDLDGIECCRYRYVDDVVNITWYVSDVALNYSFVNKTDSLMVLETGKIFGHDWDGHPESYGSAMEKPRFYSRFSLPSHTFCTGYLIPMSHYPDAKHSDADPQPFLPQTFGSEREALREARRWEDKCYQLRFPLVVGSVTYHYLFTFVSDGISAFVPVSSDRQPQMAVTEDTLAEPSLMAQYAGRVSYQVRSRGTRGLTMRFCPEGGHLIAGVSCRVAFQATEKGVPAVIDGMTDDDGNSLDCVAQQDGMGCFNIRVADDHPHQVKVRSGGKKYLIPLPKAETSGCALRVDPATQPGYLNITVTARHAEADSLYTYTLSRHGKVFASDTLTLATVPEPVGGVSLAFERISLPMHIFYAGTTLLTIRNASGTVEAQRLIYIPLSERNTEIDNTALPSRESSCTIALQYLPEPRARFTACNKPSPKRLIGRTGGPFFEQKGCTPIKNVDSCWIVRGNGLYLQFV